MLPCSSTDRIMEKSGKNSLVNTDKTGRLGGKPAADEQIDQFSTPVKDNLKVIASSTSKSKSGSKSFETIAKNWDLFDGDIHDSPAFYSSVSNNANTGATDLLRGLGEDESLEVDELEVSMFLNDQNKLSPVCPFQSRKKSGK